MLSWRPTTSGRKLEKKRNTTGGLREWMQKTQSRGERKNEHGFGGQGIDIDNGFFKKLVN